MYGGSMTTGEAAELLGLSRVQCWRLARDGKIPAVKTRAGYVFEPAFVVVYAQDRTRRAVGVRFA
jgi:excisionase family DNA binding protein